MLLVNNAMYESWPAEVKTAVEESVAIATTAQRGFAAAEDEEVLAALDPSENDVVHLSDEERGEFQNAVAPLLASQKERLGEELFALVR